MTKAEIIQLIHEDWLTFIMRGDTAEETLETCEALIAGGVRLVEAAFTTPDVTRVLSELRRRHGDEIVLSAGTVRTPEQARIAVDCGVDVIVAPDLHPPVVEVALKNGKVSIPGCATPSEIAEALRLGADIIKLFPCYHLGPEYVRYILAPFPEARILPAGSVTYDNMRAYYDAGAFAGVAGVTTECQLRDAIKARRFDEVTAVASVFVKRARELGRD